MSAIDDLATGSEEQRFQQLWLKERMLGRTTLQREHGELQLRLTRCERSERTLRNRRERRDGFGRSGVSGWSVGPCKGSEGKPASVGERERAAQDPAREGRVAANQLRLGSGCLERAGRETLGRVSPESASAGEGGAQKRVEHPLRGNAVTSRLRSGRHSGNERNPPLGGDHAVDALAEAVWTCLVENVAMRSIWTTPDRGSS